jgi:hypothetical protein
MIIRDVRVSKSPIAVLQNEEYSGDRERSAVPLAGLAAGRIFLLDCVPSSLRSHNSILALSLIRIFINKCLFLNNLAITTSLCPT